MHARAAKGFDGRRAMNRHRLIGGNLDRAKSLCLPLMQPGALGRGLISSDPESC